MLLSLRLKMRDRALISVRSLTLYRSRSAGYHALMLDGTCKVLRLTHEVTARIDRA